MGGCERDFVVGCGLGVGKDRAQGEDDIGDQDDDEEEVEGDKNGGCDARGGVKICEAKDQIEAALH